ncbi:oligosaccharide flippase family protein, partial [Vibrio diabolicus]|uniref:oligosaccharide flippase family protein n=1 Tax=Vibrio diabolicus TaxID=50719 RepID=UPI00293FB55E
MKSVILVTIEKYYSSLLLALFGFFSAKYMSIENFGLLTQVQVIVSIATIFALSGVDQLVQREFVNHNFTANECLNTVALLKLACFLISYPITALFCIIVFDKNLAILVSVFYPYVLFVALKVYASSLICEGKFLKFLSISSFISTISFVVKFLSIYYHS